ncbi:HPP family protein [Nonomuraea sp. NPDC048881]|uniref:HPP family protein n=1 Tax=Nonomuraea sp. NPDC048881 TaxID=3155030 RepID=UPI0033F38F64
MPQPRRRGNTTARPGLSAAAVHTHRSLGSRRAPAPHGRAAGPTAGPPPTRRWGWAGTSGAPARPSGRAVALATAAALAGLSLLALLAGLTGMELFALPFAATAGIVALAPAAPFAQPRSILLGHLSATALALALTALTGPSVWTAVAAAALSTAPMLLLRAPHPPAGATAALIGLTAPDPVYLLDPVLVASVVVIAAGVALGRALPGHRYPAYWR